VRALEYFEAAPSILVPDQLRSAVKRPDRYDPTSNDAFAELGQHYGLAIIPAPPRKPKGKAKVEAGVLIAPSLDSRATAQPHVLLARRAQKRHRGAARRAQQSSIPKLPGTRREAFETFDRPVMKALPKIRFELPQRKKTRASIDYHVEFDGRYYSVPFKLRQQPIEVRATPSVIECQARASRRPGVDLARKSPRLAPSPGSQAQRAGRARGNPVRLRARTRAQYAA
jgi:hypothetical protein